MRRLPTFVSILIIAVFPAACTPAETQLVARTAQAVACSVCSATTPTVEDAAGAYAEGLATLAKGAAAEAARAGFGELAQVILAALAAGQKAQADQFAALLQLAREHAAPPEPAAAPSSPSPAPSVTP